nr:PREDICTED: uncharacterized protein LOC109030913 [Bemisia tabaci]XP_018897681.1 PREDICTED: uncharacterized protein LOC109030913 [Bemisia tabaci]
MRLWGLLAFFGGFLVCQATFYIEFRRHGQKLYECSRPNLLAYYNPRAGIQVTCKQVTDTSPDQPIYKDYNFYLVTKPAVGDGDYVVLTDSSGRRTRGSLPDAYMMGVLNSSPDHLIFPDATNPTDPALTDSREKVTAMGPVVGESFKEALINYIANPSAMLLHMEPNIAASWLGAFAALLRRLTEVYGYDILMNIPISPRLREPVGNAMRLAVKKMIDPCMVYLHSDAEGWCSLYCRFLNVAARFFRKLEHKLTHGACRGTTRYCICYQSPSFVQRLFLRSNGRPMQQFNALVRLSPQIAASRA